MTPPGSGWRIRKLVPRPGVEPGTRGFSVRCSTGLSYLGTRRPILPRLPQHPEPDVGVAASWLRCVQARLSENGVRGVCEVGSPLLTWFERDRGPWSWRRFELPMDRWTQLYTRRTPYSRFGDPESNLPPRHTTPTGSGVSDREARTHGHALKCLRLDIQPRRTRI